MAPFQLNSNARGVPLRWLAKEVLNEGKYSEASDVYAFGVCLWEIYTYAREFGIMHIHLMIPGYFDA